jgi:hypothetical protein
MQLTAYRAAQSSRSRLHDVGCGANRSASVLRSPDQSLKVSCQQIFSSATKLGHCWVET